MCGPVGVRVPKWLRCYPSRERQWSQCRRSGGARSGARSVPCTELSPACLSRTQHSSLESPSQSLPTPTVASQKRDKRKPVLRIKTPVFPKSTIICLLLGLAST